MTTIYKPAFIVAYVGFIGVVMLSMAHVALLHDHRERFAVGALVFFVITMTTWAMYASKERHESAQRLFKGWGDTIAALGRAGEALAHTDRELLALRAQYAGLLLRVAALQSGIAPPREACPGVKGRCSAVPSLPSRCVEIAPQNVVKCVGHVSCKTEVFSGRTWQATTGQHLHLYTRRASGLWASLCGSKGPAVHAHEQTTCPLCRSVSAVKEGGA